MKRIFGSTLALAALITVLPSCGQPKANCTAGVGGFAAKYTLKSGSKMGDGACDALKGEILGLMKYNPSLEGDKTHQDLTKAFLVIRTSKLGELSIAAESAGVMDSSHDVDASGDFVSMTPDDDDVCSVPKLTSSEQDLPAFQTPMTADQPAVMFPATNIKYEWSNVRLYVTTAYPGTQLVGDLTYTEGSCSASYSVVGLWPAVSCEGKDADGKPTGAADLTRCDPVADPENGRATGSGINPDLKDRVTCDPELLLCVLTAPPPSLK